MVDIVAKDRSDGDGEQREDCEDGLSGATHVTHVAVNHQGDDSDAHKTEFEGLIVLDEVAGERAGSDNEHQDVLNDGNRIATPEGVGVGGGERQVALEHVDGIFLEGEDSAVVEDAEEGDEPESEAGEDLAKVTEFEGVILLLSLTGLSVEFLIHEEIGDEHDEGDAEEHDTELDSVVDMDFTAELSKIGAENHAGGDTEAGESHLGTHSQSGLTPLEPFDDTTAHRDAGHLAATTEEHEAKGSKFGRGGHTVAEGQDSTDDGEFAVPVEVAVEPSLEASADECIADGIELDAAAKEHDSTRKDGSETDTHLVEDDTCEDEEENIDVEEDLSALHAAKRGAVPTAGILHKVLDGGQNVHKYVAAEHGKSQKQQSSPAHTCTVSQCFNTCLCHIFVFSKFLQK